MERTEQRTYNEFGALFRTERGGTQKQRMDGRVWFPQFVFTAQTLLVSYPKKLPDAVTKKQYYTFFMNAPSMLPPGAYRDAYVAALEMYPVAPYLDGQNDAYRWLHSVCNHVYEHTECRNGLNGLNGINGVCSATEWVQQYLDQYKPAMDRDAVHEDFRRGHRLAVFVLVVVLLAIVIAYNYV